MTTKNKKLEITNKEVRLIVLSLEPLELGEKEACARRRFLRIIKKIDEERKSELLVLQDKYVKKDLKGNKVVVDNQYQFDNGKKEIFAKENDKLRDKVVEVSIDGNEKDVEVCVGVLEAEIKKNIDEAKGKFTADAFEYVETLKELVEKLK